MTVTKTPDELRAEAAAHDASAQESFDRCDTDGFLSQWASGITAQLKRRQADLLDAGGKAEFPALFKDGQLVAAKVIQTRYGAKFGVLASDDPRSTVTAWITPTSRGAKKHGYTLGRVLAPAAAKLHSTSHRGSVFVLTYRTDGGFSRDVTVVTTNEDEG